jgi:hypothetical protein
MTYMTSIVSPSLISGTEALSALAYHVVKYTGGDSSLGRRVRFSASVALLAIAFHTAASGRSRRNAIQKDPRKVGKAVGGESLGRDGFDEYDVVIVGGGICQVELPRCALS